MFKDRTRWSKTALAIWCIASIANECLCFFRRIDHGANQTDRTGIEQLADNTWRGRGNFDGRLVGHHVDEFLVFSDRIADLLVPLHDFGLGDAFADIGHVEGEFRHGDQSLRILSMASPMRIGPGK